MLYAGLCCAENGASCLPRHPAETLLPRSPHERCRDHIINPLCCVPGFNLTEASAGAHWVTIYGGNGGYAGSFRRNPAYQVLATYLSSLREHASAQPPPPAAPRSVHLLIRAFAKKHRLMCEARSSCS